MMNRANQEWPEEMGTEMMPSIVDTEHGMRLIENAIGHLYQGETCLTIAQGKADAIRLLDSCWSQLREV